MKYSFLIITLLVFLSLPTKVHAQYEEEFKLLSTQDGLSQNSVEHILQDSRGVMWFANQAGVDQYNGRRIEPVRNLKNVLTDDVKAIFDLRQENSILVLTDSSRLFKIDRDKNKATQPKINIPKGLTFIEEHKNQDSLLFMGGNKIYSISLELDEFHFLDSIPTKSKIEKVYQGSKKNNFIILTKKEVFVIPKNQIGDGKLKKPLRTGEYDSAILESGNRLYLGRDSLKIEIYKLFPDNKKPQLDSTISVFDKISIKEEFIKKTDRITSLLKEDKNLIWIGTNRSGLYKYNVETGKIIETCHAKCSNDKHTRIASNTINTIHKSPDNILWIGAGNKGVNYIKTKTQKFDHDFQGSVIDKKGKRWYDNQVWSILPIDNEYLFVGTGQDGVALINIQTKVESKNILPIDEEEIGIKRVFSLKKKTPDSDSIFIGTGNGLYTFSQNSIKRVNELLKYDSTLYRSPITFMEYDSINSVWVVGFWGEERIHILDQNFNTLDSIMLKTGRPSTLKIIDNNYWIPTTNGVFIYKNDNGKIDLINSFAQENDKVHVVNLVKSKDSVVWLGTDRKGLISYTYQDGKYKLKERIDDPIILNEVIYALVEDIYGNIWLSTNHGLFLYNPLNNLFNKYIKKDGLQEDEFNVGAFVEGEKRIYFGGINGITSFTPDSINLSKKAKERILINLSYPSSENDEIKEEIVIYLNDVNNYIKEITEHIPNEFEYLEINPIILNYEDISKNQFRIKLEGKKEYFEPIDGKFILTRGDLNRAWEKSKLLVQYRTSDTNWSEIHEIIIKRPWFSTRWWFLFILIASIILTILILWYRNAKGWKKLSSIQSQINEISRLETTSSITERSLTHMVDSFGFDYAVIFLIDLYDRKISTNRELFKSNEKKVQYSEDWLGKSIYNIDTDDDILVQVVKKGESPICIGDKVYSPTISPDCLNQDIFKDNDHQNLARIFIPIIHRTLPKEGLGKQDLASNEDNDIVIGVIEMGYKMTYWNRFLEFLRFSDYKTKLEEAKLRLNLEVYVDNFAQPFYRAFIKEERKNLYKEITDLIQEEYEDHYEFMQEILNKVSAKIHVDYGNIAFKTFNTENIDFHEKEISYGYSRNESITGLKKHASFNKGKKGITQLIIDKGDSYFTGDTNKDPYYIKTKEAVNSEMGLRLKNNDNGEIIGAVVLSSKLPDYFNKLHVKIFRKIIDRATEIFLKKKQYQTLKDLTLPFDILSQSSTAIYKKAVDSLTEYFDSNYVSVWIIESSEDLRFRLSEATPLEFQKEYKNIGLINPKITKGDFNEMRQTVINIQQVDELIKKDKDTKGKKESRIVKLCRKMHFKSYVIVRIIVEGKYEAFINVFSRRKLANKFDQYTEQFLEQIAKKVALASQTIKLLTSIQSISESLSQPDRSQNSPLQKIVDNAYALLPDVDLVVLFPYQKGKEIKVLPNYKAGNFPVSDTNEPNKRANLANLIIEKGTQWIENKGQYIELAKQSTPDRKIRDLKSTFWYHNFNNKNLEDKKMIQSVAAVRLAYQDEPIGVMFFNYVKAKDFSTVESQRFIKAFTSLATAALLNDSYIQQIQKETAKLQRETITLQREEQSLRKQKKELEKDKSEIQFENVQVYQKIEEMIPRATKASYYLIMQGINHDVKNFLFSLGLSLEEIKSREKGGKNRRILEEEIESLNRISKNINNLFGLFGYDKNPKEVFIDINEVIKGVLLFFSDKHEFIEVNSNLEENLPNLKCYKEEFSMIIYNLINNAEQAVRSKGRSFKGEILVTTRFNKIGNNFIIEIEDNGIGIDNDNLKKIFDLGYTTKGKEGLGIGLYFVRETLQDSFEGTLKVSSYKNKGTTFSLEIPKNN